MLFLYRWSVQQPRLTDCLAWLDARELGLDDPIAHFEANGVGLSNGAFFGAPGFVRLNFGCPRKMLECALERMEAAYHKVAG